MSRKSGFMAQLVNRKAVILYGQKWRILRVSERDMPEGEGWIGVGRCSPLQRRVLLLRDLAKGAAAEALLHEVLHGLLHLTGLDAYLRRLHPDAEEEVVSRLAPGLLAFLEDNT